VDADNPAAPEATSPISDQQIAERAYYIYLDRLGASPDSDGSDVDDWIQAERELRGEQ
jgi:hypothetical protein